MTKPPSKPPTKTAAPSAGPSTAISTPPAKPSVKPPTSSKPTPAARAPKTFAIAPWTGANEGEKIVAYGKSGNGKSTLAAQLPGAVFFGFDDGGRKIRNPLTGEPVNSVPGLTCFEDVRDALRQKNLFADDATIVLDTMTKLEEIVEPYIFANYKASGDKKATAMRAYGWDGPAHLLDVFRLLLTDLDSHVRAGRNVMLLCQENQISVANAEGIDYLQDGPKLQHNKQYSNRNEICEWADHVLRIGYLDFTVEKDSDKAKVGKVQQADATRAIYTGGAPHFIAKSRPVHRNRDGPYRIPAVVGFSSPADNSLWQFIFEGATAE